MGFLGDRWKNVHFESKPKHVTPQIDCLGKMSTVLRVSTHIYGVSKETDGEMFIFRVNLVQVTPQIDRAWKNKHCYEGFEHTFMRFQGDRWENIHF